MNEDRLHACETRKGPKAACSSSDMCGGHMAVGVAWGCGAEPLPAVGYAAL
jgi:hypothetical protein